MREALPSIKTDTLPGPKAQEILKRREEAIPGAIRCIYPCVIERGEGAMVEDVDGNTFLDWIGGVGVLNLGYSHPKVIEAVREQSGKYFHAMMNIITHENYIKLAEKLNEIVPVKGDKRKTMLANSGAEAVENAVKIAKAYTKRPNIIVFSGAFHGRTLLAMTMTASKKYAVGMGPFPDGVYRVEFPYLYRSPEGYSREDAISFYYNKLLRAFEDSTPAEYVAAVVVEPVQGEGGFIPAPIEWVKALRKLCDEKGILLVADEIQTGFARSGRMFASEYWVEEGCAPDIITTAKSIAAGLPLSGITARAEIFDAVPPGTIGGTYSGNAVACAAALAVIEAIEEEQLCKRSLQISEKYRSALEKMASRHGIIGDIRGLGCMMGVELVKDLSTKEPGPDLVNHVVQFCAQKGLLIENAGVYGNVLRFLCPLVVTDAQLEAGIAILDEALESAIATCLGQPAAAR